VGAEHAKDGRREQPRDTLLGNVRHSCIKSLATAGKQFTHLRFRRILVHLISSLLLIWISGELGCLRSLEG
jgi:hypothetical protein